MSSRHLGCNLNQRRIDYIIQRGNFQQLVFVFFEIYDKSTAYKCLVPPNFSTIWLINCFFYCSSSKMCTLTLVLSLSFVSSIKFTTAKCSCWAVVEQCIHHNGVADYTIRGISGVCNCAKRYLLFSLSIFCCCCCCWISWGITFKFAPQLWLQIALRTCWFDDSCDFSM